MKKFILPIVLLCFIAACSKNDSSTSNSGAQTYIQGTWDLTGLTKYYYNSSNQVVYSEHNIDGNVGYVRQVLTKDTIYSYYRYNNSPNYTLDTSLSYKLNTSANPVTLTASDGSIILIPLLTNSQMVWSLKQTPDSYQDSTTMQVVPVAYSIWMDTLTKK